MLIILTVFVIKALRSSTSRASRRRSAGRAFEASSIARQGEVAALGAGVACVALEAGVFASTRFLAGGRHGDRSFGRNIGRDRGRRGGIVRVVILRFRRTGRSEGHWIRGDRGVGGEVFEAGEVGGVRGSRNMSEIVSAEVGDGELAENVVEDRGRVLDPVVAPNEAGRLEAGEGEGVDVFLERHAVLQAERHGDRKIVHQRPEGGSFLVHVDKNLAKAAVRIFAGAKIDLVATNVRLLGVTGAPVRQALAGGATLLPRRDGSDGGPLVVGVPGAGG